VIGVPGDAGDTIRAYINLREWKAIGVGEVFGYCCGKIASHKIPEEFFSMLCL